MASGRTLALMLSVLTLAACPPVAQAKGFLHGGSRDGAVNASAFQQEIRQAAAGLQGCGGHVDARRLGAVEARLLPIWRSLPKNSRGRIERSLLRHLVHRYFMQKSAIVIRGFEDSRPAKQSDWGTADILSKHLPGYVESVLMSQHANENGFDLNDAVRSIALLEELIFESETSILERAYADAGLSEVKALDRKELHGVLRNYLIRWLFASEGEDFVEKVVRRPYKMLSLMPHWNEIVAFAEGQVKSLDFQRLRMERGLKLDRGNVFEGYTMSDAHQVVGDVTTSFSSYWESECDAMKMKLVSLDKHHTGRVPLSEFHSEEYKLNFAESTEYLRELGALDETSRWSGPQVIIPNYIQGPNNCLVSTPHYLVCCVNFCESIHGDIEGAIGAPVATASQILALVASMSEQTTVDHDHYAETKGALASQLEQIAAAHGGRVPLHGRLFAQWLHYVFPRECPFPHRTGAVLAATPREFGDGHLATDMEKAAHVSSKASDTQHGVDKEELHWMSQWSSDEELIADYGVVMRPPWETGRLALGGAAMLLVVGLLGAAGLSGRRTLGSEASPELCKAHFV